MTATQDEPLTDRGALSAVHPSEGGRDGRERVLGLDGLRGLLALAVVIFHYGFRYFELFGTEASAWFLEPFQLAVEGFFVLSGYVIVRSVRPGMSALSFARKRAKRLYPEFWLAVLATSAVLSVLSLPGRAVPMSATLANLTMFHWVADVPDVDGVYWSLKVELVFYVLVGLGIAWLASRRHGDAAAAVRGPALPALLLAGSAFYGGACLLSDAVCDVATSASMQYWHLFAAGCALGILTRTGHRAGWILLGIAATVQLVFYGVVPTLVLVIVAALIHRSVTRPHGLAERVLSLPPLLFLGTISYAWYLVHQNIGYVTIRRLTLAGAPQILAAATAVVCTAVLAFLLTVAADRMRRIRVGRILRRAAVARADAHSDAAV